MDTKMLKDVVEYGITAAKLVDNLAHGFAMSELGQGFELLKNASHVIGGSKAALAQYLSMDDAARDDLLADIKANIDGFHDESVQEDVEVILDFVVGLSSVIQVFVKPKPQGE